jgi:hypothetical protein
VTCQYTYQYIGDETAKSLVDPGKVIIGGTKNHFLRLLQIDHPEYWHCMICEVLHRKRYTQNRIQRLLETKIAVGLRAPGLLLPITVFKPRCVQSYHNSHAESGLCPSILNYSGFTYGRSGLFVNYQTLARISDCQILWKDIFNIDWTISSINAMSVAGTPFQICEHNWLVQNRLVRTRRKMPPFICLCLQRPITRRTLPMETANSVYFAYAVNRRCTGARTAILTSRCRLLKSLRISESTGLTSGRILGTCI